MGPTRAFSKTISPPLLRCAGQDDLMGTQKDSLLLQATWNSTVLFKKVYPKTA